MSDQECEREEIDGAVLTIYQDIDAEMPRGGYFDCFGVIVDWHRRDDIGDIAHGDRKATETELDALRRGGWPLLKRYLRATSITPAGMYTSEAAHTGAIRADGIRAR